MKKHLFFRTLLVLIGVLIMSVGQMWANSNVYDCNFTYNDGSDHTQDQSASGMADKDLGTLSSNLTIKAVYLKVWDDSYDGKGRLLNNAQLCYTINNWSSTSYVGEGSWTQSDKNGNNYQLEKSSVTWTLASLTDASGSYTLKYYWQVWGDGDKYLNNGGSNYQFTYKIAPPAISSFSVSRSGYLAGEGTSDNPYVIPYNGTLTLTVNGSKAHTDGNSTLKYWKNSESKQNSNVLTVTGITSTETASVVVHAQCINNSSSSLVGTESTETIYYKSEAAYTVTVNNDGGGSTTPSGAQSNIGTLSGVSISTSPNDGKEFSSWEIISGTGTFESSTGTSSNKFFPTSAATIRANFRSNRALTVAAGSNISSVSGSTDPVTLGSKYDISATAATGYTFSSWSADPAANATFDDASSASTKVTVKNGSVTVTASAIEWMSSLSTSCHYDAGDPSYAAPAVSGSASNVGYATTRTITATAAGTGYTFAGWTLTNCTRTDGGVATANPITIRSNGDGAAVSVVANYTEVLTTDWKVIGDNQSGSPFGDNYAYASGKAMSKKTGHATEANAYRTIDVTKLPGSYYGFKVATAAGNSNAWGYGESDGYYITFNRSASGTQKQVYNGNQHELKFVPDALGEYEFRVNYPGNKYVYVTFPTAYTVTFGKGTGGSSVTAKYNTVSFTTDTKVQSGKTVRFTQTASTGYQFKEWNTNSSGTGTQLSTNSSYYDHTVASSNTVYAIYDPKQYTITLNDQDATTAVSPATVNATYKSLTLSSAITNPEKDGYTFGGWYSAVGGGGYLIINTSGALQASKSGYTDATGWTKTSAAELYAKWTQVLVLDKNGGATDGGLTVVYKKTATSGHTAATRTGYTLNGYYDAESSGNKIINSNGSLVSYSASVSSYIRTDGSWGYNGTPTLYAQWTAKSYDVTLKPNGATTGSDQDVRATYDATMPTQTKTSAALVAPTKTGYTLQGFYQNSNGTGTKYYNANMTSANNWDQDGNANIWAIWQANPYVVTLDVDETNQGNIEGATTSQNVSYDGATTTVLNRPTAANGYALDGYYTDHAGEGTKVINADGTWIASVAGYTDGSKHWVHDGSVTLYAYYKKAEITNIEFSAGTVVENGSTVTVTATISPTPTGTTTVCWRILYDDESPLSPQPAFTPNTAQGNSVSFTAPAASGMYKVEAVLHTGSGCAGTDLNTLTADFQVAGSHTVTVRYHDGSGNSIKANTSVIARPLDWSEEAITAPDDIFGYLFERWEAGDGVSITDDDGTTTKTTTTASSIKIKASYDGTLTAVYKPADILYFKNTMGWSNVYVYFYTSDKYWDQTYYGSGTWKEKQFCEKKKNDQGEEYDDCTKPYYNQKHGQLTRLGDTDIWYIDFGALGCADWHHLVFNANQQDNYEWFSATELVRRGDLSKGTPMFVPADKSTYSPVLKNGNANYYNQGYWTKYIGDKTGYTLEVYNEAGNSLLKEIPLTGDENLMPMTAKADLEGTTNYKFQIRRDNSIYYGNSGTMTYANHGQGTPWAFTSFPGMCTITTTAAGDYKFTLTYSKDGSGNYELRMAVDYPISDGDYRLVYSDAVQTKPLTSAVVPHMANKDTIVSFFIRKAQSPNLRLQKATVAGGGAITWNEYPNSGTPTNKLTSDVLNTLPQDSVYNINLHMDGSSNLSVSSVTPYEGDFYIRTDGVRNKWDNFRAADHLMTYSEYAEKNSGFTHYFMSHVYGGTSVKFVVANDYAPNISDTLVQQAGDAGHVDASGKLWYDASSEANIRFMWNRHDNSVGRAYLAAAKTDGSKFLVLRANSSSDLMDENGYALINSANKGENGYNHKAPDNSMQFVDDENWIYETTVKVLPGAYVKLYAHYHGEDFYYKGENNSTFDKDNAIQILGGSGAAEKIHVVYDFKTGRLVSAWMPSGNISTERAINADVMFLREHQGDIEQLTFSNGGKITKINTAYAVMRFNKWTLNNKSKESGHDVLSPLLSNFERDLFYVSFPFRVNLEEVFGFGTYGKHWIIEEYDGAGRAEKGYWADSKTFWTFVTNRKGKFLEPNTGYILALDLDELGESASVWDNGVEQVELYFPSYGAMPTITSSSVTYEIPAHTCNIGPRFEGGDDRRVKDSHWNILPVPTYVNINNVSFANTTWTTTADEEHVGPNFLYVWQKSDNSLTPTAGVDYTYHAMHAYIVQYCGYVTWTTSVSPATAPNRNPDAPKDAEYRLELRQNDQMVDQAFVRLSDDEHVTTGFEFNYDLSKEFNKNKANIYTMVTTQMEDGPSITETAGNCLPLTEQTTIVPVGVIARTTGDYTFAIPEGTNGVGVTLIDNETGIRTPLSALDYTVNLNAGTYNERFVLEISPIHHMPTGIDLVESQKSKDESRKVLIDGNLYIVKDGKMFDARGARVQ